jgi:hypothetical protein
VTQSLTGVICNPDLHITERTLVEYYEENRNSYGGLLMKLGVLSVVCEEAHAVTNLAVKDPNRISNKLSCGLHSNKSIYRLQTTTHFFFFGHVN